jgi:HAD superfamily hydrolase (TIGR01490 family)
MQLVLFDLDNTLLRGDSDFEWAQFLIEKGVLDKEVYEARNQIFYDQYKSGTLDIHEFLDFQLQPLSRHPRSTLDSWHAEFMRQKILPIITQPALDLIARHKTNKHLMGIVTATNSFITAPICRYLGVPHLIATEPESVNGEFTGKALGTPCFREGKITKVETWLREQGLTWGQFEKSYFYSDSLNDLPLLNRVTHPVAVNPDPVLRLHAQEKSWPIIELN